MKAKGKAKVGKRRFDELKVFVNNLKIDVAKIHVMEFLKDIGFTVHEVYTPDKLICPERNSRSCVVECEDEEQAAQVMTFLHGNSMNALVVAGAALEAHRGGPPFLGYQIIFKIFVLKRSLRG